MGKGSSTTTSTSAPSAAASNLINPAAADAATAASNPFQFFPGQTVANLTPQQLAGMSEVNNATNIANPFINAASTLTQSGTQPIGASQINQYMNPYLSDVASTTSAEINQNNAIQQNQLQGNAAALGALGGNRVGTAQAQLANQQDLAENQQIANIYQGGYNTALGAAQTTNAQQLQGAALEGSLGTEAQNTQLAGANAQLAAGSAAQNEQQNQLNSAFSQFEASQAFPFQSSQFLTGTDAELASLLGGTSATTVPPPSTFSQVVGGLGAIAGIAGNLKTGGRVGKDGGGGVVGTVSPDYLNGISAPVGPIGNTIPGPPPAFDPNAKTDGSQPNGGGGGGGGGGLGGVIKIAGAAGLKTGGRANYDVGGGIPYDTGAAGYFPALSFGAPHGNSIPSPPPAFDPNAGTDGSQGKSAAQTGATVAQTAKSLYQQGQQVFGGQQSAVSGGLAPTPTSTFLNAPGLETEGTFLNPNQNYNEGQAGIEGGFSHGGRIRKADGGTSLGTPSSGIDVQIEGSQPSEEESIENYSMLAGLLPGSQPPAYHYGQSPSTSAEESNSGMEYSHGGIARAGRASGGTSGVAAAPATGALPAFTPVGGQQISAPQPATTAGAQTPTTWGNVALPSAPQLSTAPVAQLTPQDIQASIALPTGGIQNNYTGYIEGLQGSNPSIGNRAPQTNTFGAAAPGAFNPAASIPTGTNAINPDDFSTPDLTALMNGLSTSNFKKGGRANYDDGGPISQYAPDGVATPLTSGNIAPDGAPVMPVGPQGNSAPAITPVQSQPLPPPAPAPTPVQQGIGAIAPAQAAPVAPAAPKPQASTPTQGLGAVAPAPTKAGLSAAQPQSNTLYQPPVNNPGNLRVPGSNTAFQQFKSPAEGWDAMSTQLMLDNKPVAEGGHGLSTISQIVSSWAPPNENDTASYIKNVSAETGIDPNAKIDLTDPAILGKVQTAMAHQEGSKAPPGTQMAQNLVQQPAYVDGQVATDASPNYLNPAGATQGNAGIPQPANNPYSGDQTEVDKIANNPWTALAAAGFATLAGTSPFAAVNIGQGGLAGLQYLQGTENQQRQNAATQQAQTGVQQTSSAQRLQAQAQQNVYTTSLINTIPGLSDAQRMALGYNASAKTNGWPMQQVPGALPPGLPPEIVSLSGQQPQQPMVNPQTYSQPVVPQQTITGAVGGVPPQGPISYNPQGQAVIAPTFAQNATGIVPTGQSSVDTTTLGPSGQPMPYRQAFQTATGDLSSPYAPAQAQGKAWMDTYGPAAQQQVVKNLQDIANQGQAQSSQLDELQSQAENIHSGPVTGPILASAVKAIQDVGSLFNIDTSGITASSDAAQVIPKLSTTLLAAAGKMASDQGGYEALRMMQSSVPTLSNTGTAVQQIVQIYNTMNQRAQALASYTNNVVSQGVGTPAMASASFNQMYPPDLWASRVSPLPVPATTTALKPGYSYQSGGRSFIWGGNGWVNPQ